MTADARPLLGQWVQWGRNRVARLLLLALVPVLGSCALLVPRNSGQVAAPAVPVTAPPAAPLPSGGLSARGRAVADAQAVTVWLTVVNEGLTPISFRYTPQVNWGGCELPPLVAIVGQDGTPVTPPARGRLGCTELLLQRTLEPGASLTLKRELPPLPLGRYRLTLWLDADQKGLPLRVQAPVVVLAVQ